MVYAVVEAIILRYPTCFQMKNYIIHDCAEKFPVIGELQIALKKLLFANAINPANKNMF